MFPSRRQFLQLATAGVPFLAGCNALDEPTPTRPPDTNSQTPTPTPTPSSSPTPSPTEIPSRTPGPTPEPDCFPEGTVTPAAEEALWIALDFEQTVQDEGGRELSIRVDSITIHGGAHDYSRTYDVGNDVWYEDEPKFLNGVYEREEENGRTYRWFGKRPLRQFEEGSFGGIDEIHFTLDPVTTPLSADVCHKIAYSVTFERDGWQRKAFSLHE